MSLDKNQQAVQDEYLETNNNIFVTATAGCFERGTKIRMFDRTLRNIEDIKEGEDVMGPDWERRLVFSTAHGNGPLYRVQATTDEDSFVVNQDHLLTVYDEGIVDIPLMDIYRESGDGQVVQRYKLIEPTGLKHDFEISEKGEGEWFGISVNKDRRFLLHNDIIQHNSGKTYTLLQLLRVTPPNKRCIFLAFNKSIATELSEKVPQGVETSTIHSKSFGIMRKNLNLNVKLSDSRDYGLCRKILDFNALGVEGYKEQNAFINIVMNIHQAMRLNLLFTQEELVTLCLKYNIDANDKHIEAAIELRHHCDKLEKSMNKKQPHLIDFTDMLYLTWKYVDGADYPKYDVVAVDECQDINPLQREIILKMKKKNGRMVCVGDEKQAIYSFQYSSLDSLNHLKNLPHTTVLPLSRTYRCSKAIVKEAQRVFPDGIEAVETAEEGVVRKGSLSEAKQGDYVICRNNLPLVQSYIYLLRNNKKSIVMGKDLETALTNLLEKIDTFAELKELKFAKIDDLKAKGITNPKNHPSYVDLEEKCSILELLEKQWGTVAKVSRNLHEIFDEGDKSESIVLCTIHKSKGLETDRVFALNTELLFKRAETELEVYAERCLNFVLITRARKELVYCNIDEDGNIKL